MKEKDKGQTAEEEKDYKLEQLFDRLDDVAEQLESGEASLEDSFRLYKQGMDMLKLCGEKIDMVEKQILVMEEDGQVHEF